MFRFYYKKVNGVWEEISELELHAKLYVHVKQTTPIIKMLLQKNYIHTLSTQEEFKIDCIKM